MADVERAKADKSLSAREHEMTDKAMGRTEGMMFIFDENRIFPALMIEGRT